MRSLVLSFLVLIIVKQVKMQEDLTETRNILDDILVHPIPAPESKVYKREVPKDTLENIDERLLAEKLIKQSQALEQIVQKMDRHEEAIKQLLENLSKTLEKPKLPTKIEIEKKKPLLYRRSNSDYQEPENPILRLGKNLPIYGRLAKDLFMKEIQSDTDPTPLVERNPDDHSSEYSRRSFGGNPEVDPSPPNKVELSPWCEAAMHCKKTGESMCGFDDNYGYGKFDDICHMQHVNCYYKYNFVLAHTCHPTI